MIRYLSVCSGIEAATVAWHPLGFVPVAFSEIEPFPCAVLAHHYPGMPNWGDMTRFKEWPDAVVDLLVGGTPCQSFSVAGLRKGLDDPRGNLMLTYLAIADRYRPRWLVWENVPGVLSADGGAAFGTLLGGMAELGYGFAYRILDAQHFGVPQRRRRVFVVGHLGDWRRAAAVLFERHSLSGDQPPSRKARQDVAGTFKACAGSGGWGNSADHAAGGYMQPAYSLRAANTGGNGRGVQEEVAPALDQAGLHFVALTAPTLSARSQAGGGLGTDFDCGGGLVAGTVTAKNNASSGMRDTPDLIAFGGGNTQGAIEVATALFGKGGSGHNDFASESFIVHSLRGEGFDASEDGTGRGTPIVPIAIHPHCIGRSPEAGPQGKEYLDDGAAYTLDARNKPQAVAFNWQGGGNQGGLDANPDRTSALQAAQVPAVAFSAGNSGESRGIGYTVDGTPPLRAGASGTNQVPTVASVNMAVRRLMPVECERLQGFPDHYTRVPLKQHQHQPVTQHFQRYPDLYDQSPDGTWTQHAADGPRYKALGNSMAVPVMRWIGERIALVDAIPPAGEAPC